MDNIDNIGGDFIQPIFEVGEKVFEEVGPLVGKALLATAKKVGAAATSETTLEVVKGATKIMFVQPAGYVFSKTGELGNFSLREASSLMGKVKVLDSFNEVLRGVKSVGGTFKEFSQNLPVHLRLSFAPKGDVEGSRGATKSSEAKARKKGPKSSLRGRIRYFPSSALKEMKGVIGSRTQSGLSARMDQLQKEIAELEKFPINATKNDDSNPCFQDADRLADLYLASRGNIKLQERVRKSFEQLEKLTADNPQVRKSIKAEKKAAEFLGKSVDPEDLKDGFKQAVQSLLSTWSVSEKDVLADAQILGTRYAHAKYKMVNRLSIYSEGKIEGYYRILSLAKRQELTGFEFSTIRTIEKAFKAAVQGTTESRSVKIGEEKVAYIALSERKIFLEEKRAGAGSFKVATFASEYFSKQSPEEGLHYATVKPKPEEAKPATVTAEELVKGYEGEIPEIVIGDAEDEESATFVMKSEDEEGSATVIKRKEPDKVEEAEEESSTFVIRSEPSEVEEESSTIVIRSEEKGLEGEEEEASSVVIKKESKRGPSFDVAQQVRLRRLSSAEMLIQDLSLEQLEKRLSNMEKDPESHNKNRLKAQMESEKSKRLSERKALESIPEEQKIESEEEEYLREIDITMALQGPGVVKVHTIVNGANGEKVMIQEAAGYHLDPKEGKRETAETPADLKKMAKLFKKGKLDRDEEIMAMKMFEQAFTGVKTVHEKGYILRDIKPENFLITQRGEAVAADFGTLVKKVGDLGKAEYAGTPIYSAPETLKYQGYNNNWENISQKADVWSCAMMIQDALLKGKGIKDHPTVGPLGLVAVMDQHPTLDHPDNKLKYEQKYPDPRTSQEKANGVKTLEYMVWWGTRVDPDERPTIDEFIEGFREAWHREYGV